MHVERKPSSQGEWWFFVALFLAAIAPVQAIEIDEFERRDYDLAVSSRSVLPGPGSHLRLFLDVYNVTDFFDFETDNTRGFVDGTWLADTLRPTATILWDERFRTQIGLVARKGYGDRNGFGSVDPWIQLLWQPIKPLSIVFGNLNTPHYYHPALFMPLNYVRESPVETGAQLLWRTEHWYEDLYFNYRLQDTPEYSEKFDLGFVHRNTWKWFRFTYQSHWVHEGGTLYAHPISTVNDLAQLVGVGAQIQPFRTWILGTRWSYLLCRRQIDSLNPELGVDERGNGKIYEAFTRISRFKLSFEHWRGTNYDHEGADPWFRLPRMNLMTARWDVLLSRDFNLLLRYTAGFASRNDLGVSRFIKSAIHMQASWQFSLPIAEWSTPSVVPQGQPVPARWDEGV